MSGGHGHGGGHEKKESHGGGGGSIASKEFLQAAEITGGLGLVAALNCDKIALKTWEMGASAGKFFINGMKNAFLWLLRLFG